MEMNNSKKENHIYMQNIFFIYADMMQSIFLILYFNSVTPRLKSRLKHYVISCISVSIS